MLPLSHGSLIKAYIHVLGLVLAHVAVITLSHAPIAGYNLTFFLVGNLLLLLVFYLLFAIILSRISLDFQLL